MEGSCCAAYSEETRPVNLGAVCIDAEGVRVSEKVDLWLSRVSIDSLYCLLPRFLKSVRHSSIVHEDARCEYQKASKIILSNVFENWASSIAKLIQVETSDVV
jgi:hypothetical protein